MSENYIDFKIWEQGMEQMSVVFNENMLRTQIMCSDIISSTVSVQPAAAENDVYIIPQAASGAAWSLFSANDIAIFKDNSWHAFKPFNLMKVRVNSSEKVFKNNAWITENSKVTSDITDDNNNAQVYFESDDLSTLTENKQFNFELKVTDTIDNQNYAIIRGFVIVSYDSVNDNISVSYNSLDEIYGTTNLTGLISFSSTIVDNKLSLELNAVPTFALKCDGKLEIY